MTRLRGDNGDDQLFGQTGDDLLAGGNNDDRLMGGSGDDLLVGGDGADTLNGGGNNDRLRGGTGIDMFFFASASGIDRILDFVDTGGAEDDIIDLRLYDFANLGAIGRSASGDESRSFAWRRQPDHRRQLPGDARRERDQR